MLARPSAVALVGSGAALVLATALAVSGWLAPADLLVRDAALRSLPGTEARKVALVLVDEGAIRAHGPWPWPRALLAEVVSRVRAAGALGVVVDVLLPERREGDAELAQALADGPSVLAAGVDEEGRWLLPAPPLLERAAAGHVSFDVDRDGVVRRFRATRQAEGRSLPALAVAAARIAAPSWPVPVGGVLRPGFRASRSIPSVGAGDLLDGAATGILRGRVVLVGATAAGIGDRVVTPVTPRGAPEPGVWVEAAAAESILSGDLLRPVPPLAAGLVAALLALSAGPLARRPGGRTIALAAGAVLAPLPLGLLALATLRLELPVLCVGLAVLVPAAAAGASRSLASRREALRAGRRVAELEALNASLEEVRREDAEARRVVAHELKTPLTSVRGLAQLLSDFDLSEEERKRVAGMVVNETRRLSEMVEGLLGLERLKLRDFRKVAVPVSLSRLVEERAALLAAGSGREVAARVEAGLSVLGDAELLGRVVDNLVGNALKFSPPTAPIEVALRRVGGDRVALEVTDHGPGVAPEERGRIFGRFARGAAAERAPGLGLGLALVAEGAAWHGGRAEVESPPTGGSRFRVILPLAPGAPATGRRG